MRSGLIRVLDLILLALMGLVLAMITLSIGLADAPSYQRIMAEIIAMCALWTFLFYIAATISRNRRPQIIASVALLALGILLFLQLHRPLSRRNGKNPR